MIATLVLAASVGVGTQGAPMCTPAMRPGSSASAGQLYVTDTGSQAETVTVGTFPAGGQGQALRRGQRPMPAGWVHVSYPRKWLVLPQSSLDLQPGGYAYLPVTVAIPDGTAKGIYGINVWAHTTASGSPGSGVTASTGAGAATLLYAGVDEAPSCAVAAPVKQAGAPWQYVPASAVTPASGPETQSRGFVIGLIAVVVAAVYVLGRLRKG